MAKKPQKQQYRVVFHYSRNNSIGAGFVEGVDEADARAEWLKQHPDTVIDACTTEADREFRWK